MEIVRQVVTDPIQHGAGNEFMNNAELANYLRSMTAQDIRLIGGEMSSAEVRTVTAFLNWCAAKVDEVGTGEETKPPPACTGRDM